MLILYEILRISYYFIITWSSQAAYFTLQDTALKQAPCLLLSSVLVLFHLHLTGSRREVWSWTFCPLFLGLFVFIFTAAHLWHNWSVT